MPPGQVKKKKKFSLFFSMTRKEQGDKGKGPARGRGRSHGRGEPPPEQPGSSSSSEEEDVGVEGPVLSVCGAGEAAPMATRGTGQHTASVVKTSVVQAQVSWRSVRQSQE